MLRMIPQLEISINGMVSLPSSNGDVYQLTKHFKYGMDIPAHIKIIRISLEDLFLNLVCMASQICVP